MQQLYALSPVGFVDHRAAVPVVIPWDHIRAIGYRGGGQARGWALELILTDGGRGTIVVPASRLKVTPKELVRLVQDFSPGVELERAVRIWLG